ncbi:MAG: apolipoprotein N-acyltransferase [Bacteroidota bacterium]|nr:apolipoprotein N-acyltransferase [Bacteroidota bacterium]
MNKLLLALLSGFLLAFSWPAIGLFPLVFIAFIPLFILEKESENGKQIFWYSFLAFFIFNTITTYWVYHATPVGAIVAFFVNATLMATVFLLFHKIKKVTSNKLGYLSFIMLWISMEYLHLNWDLSWPWLTLGNVFAYIHSFVQWYEFTGFLGGSLWVILTNLLLFRVYQKEDKKKVILFPIFSLLLPLFVSHYMYFDFEEKNDKSINVLIVQPNVDPYIDKFSTGYQQQLADFIALARTELSQETQLMLAPETALLEGIWENKLEATFSIRAFRELQKEFPNLNILVGATTYKMFGHSEQKTNTAREIRHENIFYDAYNSAVFIPDSGDVQIYHKTKLVPGAETMPFPYILDPLAKLVVNLGGTSGSLGSENYLNSFLVGQSIVSPLICYESIYGEMRLGKTNLLAVITNDGWWKNTAGHKQHFTYARLRAIEQRKSVIRSANTGISGVINSRGDVLRTSRWDEAACLTAKVNMNNTTTFYNQFGDYIGRLSVFFAVMLLIIAFVKGRLRG